jgi:hypothetical protein
MMDVRDSLESFGVTLRGAGWGYTYLDRAGTTSGYKGCRMVLLLPKPSLTNLHHTKR